MGNFLLGYISDKIILRQLLFRRQNNQIAKKKIGCGMIAYTAFLCNLMIGF